MSNAIIFAGIAVGVIAIGAAIAYGTANQQNYIQDDAVLSQPAEQGLLPKTGMFGAELNKEKWHEEPFGDIVQKVREANGR